MTLVAAWSVRSATRTVNGRTTARELMHDESGYDAIMMAHSRALARLADDIAAATRSMTE